MSEPFSLLGVNSPLLTELTSVQSPSKAMTPAGKELLWLLWEIRKTHITSNPSLAKIAVADPVLKTIERTIRGSKILQPAKARYDCICESSMAVISILGDQRLFLFDHFQYLNEFLPIIPLESREHYFKHLRPGDCGYIAECPCQVLEILSPRKVEQFILENKLLYTWI